MFAERGLNMISLSPRFLEAPPKWHQLERHNYMLSRCILSRVCLERPKPLISIRGCLFLVLRILQTIKNITIGYVQHSIN